MLEGQKCHCAVVGKKCLLEFSNLYRKSLLSNRGKLYLSVCVLNARFFQFTPANRNKQCTLQFHHIKCHNLTSVGFELNWGGFGFQGGILSELTHSQWEGKNFLVLLRGERDRHGKKKHRLAPWWRAYRQGDPQKFPANFYIHDGYYKAQTISYFFPYWFFQK